MLAAQQQAVDVALAEPNRVGIGAARFYTFNVADSAISTALFLLIVIAIFHDRLARHRPAAEAIQS